MSTTRKQPTLVVQPYCHNCKPAEQVVEALSPRMEVCSQCGRETLSGVYVIKRPQ